MRRLGTARLAAMLALLSIAAIVDGCRRRDPIQLEETQEGPVELQSAIKVADPRTATQLLKGFHAIEHQAWRWTAGRFSVSLKPPPGAAKQGGKLTAELVAPEALISRVGSTSISASIKGTPVGTASYNKAGDVSFSADVPPALLAGEAVIVDFAVGKPLPAGSVDGRELGIVAKSFSMASKP